MWSGLPRPTFGRRLLIVGVTWALLAGVARHLDPALALVLGAIPLALAARGAWATQRQARPVSLTAAFQRRAALIAVLMASALLFATLAALGEQIPPWAFLIEAGALLHYFLLSLGE